MRILVDEMPEFQSKCLFHTGGDAMMCEFTGWNCKLKNGECPYLKVNKRQKKDKKFLNAWRDTRNSELVEIFDRMGVGNFIDILRQKGKHACVRPIFTDLEFELWTDGNIYYYTNYGERIEVQTLTLLGKTFIKKEVDGIYIWEEGHEETVKL